MMEILAHRGFWDHPHERNTMLAFCRAWEHGFGIETDVRDQDGELVISHSIPSGRKTTFRSFARQYAIDGNNTTLALNIKADGLQDLLREILLECSIDRYFLFDMAVPDAVISLGHQLKCFTRLSEYEPQAAFAKEAHGVWIDCFEGPWLGPEEFNEVGQQFSHIALVSPEIHGRSPDELWPWLRQSISNDLSVYLCTDQPHESKDFFDGAH